MQVKQKIMQTSRLFTWNTVYTLIALFNTRIWHADDEDTMSQVNNYR